MLQSDIFTHLSGDAAVSAIVGTRIYPNILPPPPTGSTIALPAVRYQVIFDSGVHTLTRDAVTLYKMILQIDCYAASNQAAHQLKEAVRAALDDFQGILSSTTEIDACELTDARDEFDELPRTHRVLMEFLIWYRAVVLTS